MQEQALQQHARVRDGDAAALFTAAPRLHSSDAEALPLPASFVAQDVVARYRNDTGELVQVRACSRAWSRRCFGVTCYDQDSSGAPKRRQCRSSTPAALRIALSCDLGHRPHLDHIDVTTLAL